MCLTELCPIPAWAVVRGSRASPAPPWPDQTTAALPCPGCGQGQPVTGQIPACHLAPKCHHYGRLQGWGAEPAPAPTQSTGPQVPPVAGERAGPHPWPGSFCRLGDVHQQVQLAKAQRVISSKTEPHICRPLHLRGTRPAAGSCSVMALKYRKPWVQVFPFLMPRGSGCRLIPLLSPESPLPPGTSGLSQPSLGITLSPVTAHTGSELLSAAPGRLPRRVHSAGGVAVGTSCNSALSCSKGLLLPRLELGREWHRTGHKSAPVMLSGGFGGEMPLCSPAQRAAAASVVMAQYPRAGHTSQTELGQAHTRPCSASAPAPVGEQQSGSWGSIPAERTPPLAATKQPLWHTHNPSVQGTANLKG